MLIFVGLLIIAFVLFLCGLEIEKGFEKLNSSIDKIYRMQCNQDK